MNVTKQEYKKMYEKTSHNSHWAKDCLLAFVVGGGICAIGQVLKDLFMSMSVSEEEAGNWVSLSLILLSALLTAFQCYDNIANFAGAGTLVPITGFANSIVSPAMEFKKEGFVLGMGCKMFVIAGPVLVFGISVSVIYGVILMLFGLV